MKARLFITSILLCISFLAKAEVKIYFPEGNDGYVLNYVYAPIKQYAEAKTRAERGMVQDSVAVVGNKAIINLPEGKEGYLISFLSLESDLFLTPSETVNLTITSMEPYVTSTLSGTPLADSMNELEQAQAPILERLAEIENIQADGKNVLRQELFIEYMEAAENFIKANPQAPAAPVALMKLEGEDFISMFDEYGEGMTNSIIYPLLLKQYNAEKKSLEMEKKQEAMSSGDVMAPGFTLKNLSGKDVSLADFRGKWVILDFWGSWCPWCIKGFPELKEAYKKYAGKLEIIGIDCNESETDWKAGVEKYQLPWVNVYNPQDSGLTGEYGVQGFPTKAIVGPDGKIKNITVGHDPAFFDKLTQLLGE